MSTLNPGLCRDFIQRQILFQCRRNMPKQSTTGSTKTIKAIQHDKGNLTPIPDFNSFIHKVKFTWNIKTFELLQWSAKEFSIHSFNDASCTFKRCNGGLWFRNHCKKVSSTQRFHQHKDTKKDLQWKHQRKERQGNHFGHSSSALHYHSALALW